eukprot:SAG11_NODE_7831_length_1090_cov_7.255298_1_plen_60_part_10
MLETFIAGDTAARQLLIFPTKVRVLDFPGLFDRPPPYGLVILHVLYFLGLFDRPPPYGLV